MNVFDQARHGAGGDGIGAAAQRDRCGVAEGDAVGAAEKIRAGEFLLLVRSDEIEALQFEARALRLRPAPTY